MFCIPIIPAVFGTGTNIVINNNVFSPFNFDTADYKIYNENNELLGNVDANSEFLVWRDPTYRYPTIDVIQSSPFLTDSTGNVIKDEDLELLNPATLEIITEDDKIIYLKKFYVGWDIGLRTYSQLPPIKYYDIPISPLKNVPINHAGGSSSNVFGIYNDPSGVIMAKADVGYLQWRISFFAKDVMVRNSLEPLELTPTILRDKTNIQNDLSLAINSLESNYGNSRVIVKPTFKINAISELIKYDYVKLLENGSQLHIYTTSSKVGFFGVRNAISLKSQGLVTNALTQEILDKGINAEIDTDSPIIQTEDKTLPSDTTGYISERSYDAFFK